MNTVDQYDKVSIEASRCTTRTYSTSFSLAVRSLHPSLRDPIHAIYGFVRIADEIVDTFHGHDKAELLRRFKRDTDLAVAEKISLNPILQSFQKVVNQYGIEPELYGTFMDSMAMDLTDKQHDRPSYEKYILGSAEVVGAMCLRVFCNGDRSLYKELLPSAMSLGSAFQKLNFLRDHKDDFSSLGRAYFPGSAEKRLDTKMKREIEKDIRADLQAGLAGIRKLPRTSRFGVYIAYMYFSTLFEKICSLPVDRILAERVRIRNRRKLAVFSMSYVRHSFGLW